MNEKPILILADSEGKAWDFAKRVYAYVTHHQESTLKYLPGEVKISYFNNGEVHSRVLTNVRHHQCYFIHDASIPAQDWQESLILTNDALMRASATSINDVLPFMPYSRQHKLTESRTPISAKRLADAIMRSHADSVITTDLHDSTIAGFYEIPFDNTPGAVEIVRHLRTKHPEFLENALVMAPDLGGAKKADDYATRLRLELGFAYKRRIEAGKVGKIVVMGDIKGKNVLIVDDMIDTAGTLIKSAEAIKEAGAEKIYAAATHGIFSRDKEGREAKDKLRASPIEIIIVTESIPQEPDNPSDNGRFEIVSLSDYYGEIIKRITHSQSVSQAYNG